MVVSLPWGKSNPFDSDTFMAQVKRFVCSRFLGGLYFSVVISRSPAGAFRVFLFHHMDLEGAAFSAPDEQTSGDSGAVDVASGIALVEPGVEQTIVDTPENPVDDTVKEEEVDFNPDIQEETDIVGGFLGVEVETCDLLGIEEEPDQPSSSTLPVEGQGAAEGAPEQDLLGDVASASAEPTTAGDVAVGSSPSAPSRPPRTRGDVGVKTRSTRTTDVSFTKDLSN